MMLISGDSVSAGTSAKYLWSLLGDGLGTEKPWCCHVEQSDGKGIREYCPSSVCSAHLRFSVVKYPSETSPNNGMG